MEKHRELYIKTSGNVSNVALSELGNAIDAALANGWLRQPVSASDLAPNAADEWLYYTCTKSAGREPALLAICRANDDDTFYVPNIVPAEKSQLTVQEYNAILKDFHDTILARLTPDFSVTFVLGSDKIDLSTHIGPATFSKLKSFLVAANRDTGGSHPSDRQRWFAFLTALHLDGHRLSGALFNRWLVESENWPSDSAAILATELNFSSELLTFYETHRSEA